MLHDTIVALSTPYGESGIAIIRMSGDNSVQIAEMIFRRPDEKRVSELSDHSINYGWIVDLRKDEIIDEVFLSVLRSPRTYTKEDMIEINCHGGYIATERTMDLILDLGARIAEPGEFTQRAFLNGRIDLSQAEAVLEIIRTRSVDGLSSAIKRLNGSISVEVKELRNKIFELLAKTEAEIEFTNQIVEGKKNEEKKIEGIIQAINDIIERYERTRDGIDGLKIVVCGRPNVGKSTIINAIYGEERILTSMIPGTTRDTIQIGVILDGRLYNFIDTAGINKGKGIIERLSIENSKKAIKDSNCIIMVFDISRRLTKKDREIVKWIKGLGKDIIWTVNKIDLKRKVNIKELEQIIGWEKIIEISAKEGKGLDFLCDELKLKSKRVFKEIETGLIVNKRQRMHLSLAKEALKRAKELNDKEYSEALKVEELKTAIEELDKITGEKKEKAVLEEIFSQFCIGK